MDIPKRKAIGLKIKGDWGHFRRIDTTSVKQTYRVPPRTTVSGLLSAIVGRERNSYYDIFNPEESAVSISINNPTRVKRMSELELTTNDTALKSAKSKSIDRAVSIDSTSQDRQRNIYEWLVNPEYEIWVTLDDDKFYNELKEHLVNETTTYTPTLGKSECIATIDYLGESIIEDTQKQQNINSVVSADQAKVDNNIRIERLPYYNVKRDSGGRKLGGMSTVAYSPDGSSVNVQNSDGIFMLKEHNNNKYVRFM